MKTENTAASVRASVSFPPELYQTLEEIAKQKKVSLAWVVRDAAEQYVTGKWPLFVKQEPSS
ncbi:CopG family transcriptional regulator [Oscillatoria amoena NRMC-F 0135]|nr:CopG family transcriptional regulator [Oscillatoria amoena NRMC-F 0135]